MTFLPYSVPSFSATTRRVASGPLPGAQAVISVTFLVGQWACAKAGVVVTAAPSNAAARVVVWKIGCLPQCQVGLEKAHPPSTCTRCA